jgi:hypothetical protein
LIQANQTHVILYIILSRITFGKAFTAGDV